MKRERIVGALLFLAMVLATGFLAPSWTEAQVIAPDPSPDPQSDRALSLTEGVIVIPQDEPSTQAFDQGLERPLNVPDPMTDGDMNRLPLRTPDQSDAENVRESDEKSEMALF